MENPTIANEAITSGPREVAGIKIYPVTLARYALLELVKSPFLCKDEDFTIYNLVPSFYIMSQEKEALKGYSRSTISGLVDKAMEWAESLEPKCVSPVIDSIAEELGLIKKVQPSTPEDKDNSKKPSAQTAG